MSPGEKVRKSYSSGLCSKTEVTSPALVIVFPNQLWTRSAFVTIAHWPEAKVLILVIDWMLIHFSIETNRYLSPG